MLRHIWCGVLVFAAACAGKSTPSYTAPDSSFSIALPSEPAVEPRDGGVFVYRVADGDVTYLIRTMPMPAGFEADSSGEALYDQLQAAGVAQLQGTLLSKRAVTSGGQPHNGREFVIHAETKSTGKAYEMTTRVFRVGDEVFVVTATGPREDAARARIAPALDSFALLR